MSIDAEERQILDASIRETAASALERAARLAEAIALSPRPLSLVELAALYRELAAAVREGRMYL